MHIKIYFNDKPLFLTDSIDTEIEPYVHHDDAVFIDEFSSPGINSIIHEMRQDKVHVGILYHANLDELRTAFWKKFTLIKAAGGVVLNDRKEILLMFRRGKWDLPKGKLDQGESLEQCAVREIKEETGLKKVMLKKPLVVTYHTYDESGKHMLKETHWYLLLASGEQPLQPQTTEQITKIEWVAPKDLPKYTANMHASVRDVLKAPGF